MRNLSFLSGKHLIGHYLWMVSTGIFRGARGPISIRLPSPKYRIPSFRWPPRLKRSIFLYLLGLRRWTIVILFIVIISIIINLSINLFIQINEVFWATIALGLGFLLSTAIITFVIRKEVERLVFLTASLYQTYFMHLSMAFLADNG